MYRQNIRDWTKHLDFLLLDECSLAIAMFLAQRLSVLLGRPYRDFNFIGFCILVLLINFAVIVAFDSLRGVMSRGYLREFTATVRHALALTALVFLAMMIRTRGAENGDLVLVFAVFNYLPISYLTRTLWKKLFRRFFSSREDKRTLLIVTDTNHAAEILERTRQYSFARHTIAGLVLIDRDATGEIIDGTPVVASVQTAAQYMCKSWVDEVFFFHPALDERVEKLMSECREMAVTIHLYVNLQGVEEKKQTLEYLAGYEVLTANINLIRPMDALVKRMLDIVVGLAGSLAALLILLLFGPAILIASPGPLIFSQERIGENGRKFKMYKVRSMYPDAEARKAALYGESSHSDGMMFKMDFDPRVIGNRIGPEGKKRRGIGDFIRRTSLDEFPQFFNVLKGDMSLVGTRPPTVDEWERYQYHHRARMSVRPGLTGLWQIRPDKDTMSFEDVVKLDTDYIANWSLGRDFRIIGTTAGIILKTIFKGNHTSLNNSQ